VSGVADSLFNLAVQQKQAQQFDAALDSYQRALAAGIARPEEVHLNRSVIYTDHLHQHTAAERELKLALSLIWAIGSRPARPMPES
jgi:Tfp pilus assembly protein PilF